MIDGVNELSLARRVSERDATQGWPELVVIIDGQELFADDDGGMGVDPAMLLGEGSPLLPASTPQRVVVRVCACGEAGCGSTEVRVRREGDRYLWDDWTSTLDAAPDLPALAFDAASYESAVRAGQRA